MPVLSFLQGAPVSGTSVLSGTQALFRDAAPAASAGGHETWRPGQDRVSVASYLGLTEASATCFLGKVLPFRPACFKWSVVRCRFLAGSYC